MIKLWKTTLLIKYINNYRQPTSIYHTTINLMIIGCQRTIIYSILVQQQWINIRTIIGVINYRNKVSASITYNKQVLGRTSNNNPLIGWITSNNPLITTLFPNKNNNHINRRIGKITYNNVLFTTLFPNNNNPLIVRITSNNPLFTTRIHNKNHKHIITGQILRTIHC